jgi:hypothetical protein
MKWNRPILALLALLAAVRPLSAIQVPQTREEFVQAVSDGAGATKLERFVVERSIDDVYRDLEQNASTCLDVEVRRSGFVGNQMEVTSSDYNPTLKRTAKGSAEFTLQVIHRPRGIGHTPPPGGLYVMAADLRSLGPGRTEIVLYRPTMGFKKITKSLLQWGSGQNDGCPKLN